MLERLLVVMMLALAAVAIYQLYTRSQLKRVTKYSAQDTIVAGLRTGIPAIVYFTTPECIPCKTQQQPALQRLQAQMGDQLQIVQIDATQQPEIADRWGIFSVPTTFILDKQGRAGAVNHGVAHESKLKRQLQETV